MIYNEDGPPTFYPLFVKPETRDVSRVFIHCSASSKPDHAKVSVIDMWHRKRGFNEIGYHYLIDFDGVICHGRNLEKIPAAQKGNNTGTIAICMAGLNKEDFRMVQISALVDLCNAIDVAYESGVTFHGHCEVSNKTCPVFDYKHYLKLDADGNLNGATNEGEFFEPDPVPLQLLDRGEEVKILQSRLNIWLNSKGMVGIATDGIFGQDTAEAVINFQEEYDIVQTGRAGSLTMLMLPSRGGTNAIIFPTGNRRR